MKARESGMPEETLWSTFFDPETIFDRLQLTNGTGDIAEFGCGFGTFTLPVARRTTGTVHTFDIDPEMAELTNAKAQADGITNIKASVRDLFENGTGLPDRNTGYVLMFNILHTERPEILLNEAYRILAPGGRMLVIHWNPDPKTPRGPSMDIRPTPGRCWEMAIQAGFRQVGPVVIDLPPWHFGMIFERP